MKEPKEIIVSVHWLNGGEMIERDTLPAEHPEHTYNYIKRVYKVAPERYGIIAPEGKIRRKYNESRNHL